MALKVSKQIGLHREVERELEAFLVLRHKNIVSFYGIEEDVIDFLICINIAFVCI